MGEALEHFERAEALRPGFWLANQLWLGRAHAALGDAAAAARWLHAAGSMPVRSDASSLAGSSKPLRRKSSNPTRTRPTAANIVPKQRCDRS